MDREDERRWEVKRPRMNKTELLVLAQKVEGWMLESEAEKRAAGVLAKPRDNEPYKYQMPPPPPKGDGKPPAPKPNIKERLGPQVEGVPDLRRCNNCSKVGHLARHCPDPPRVAAAVPPSATPTTPRADMSSHKTPGATCTSCKKLGHVAAQCWSAHPEKLPQDLARKRGGTMAVMRKRQRAAEHTSPDYAFQGHLPMQLMALTYIRPTPAMMQQRSTRVAQPIQKARDAAAQATPKRVHFEVDAGMAPERSPTAAHTPLRPAFCTAG